MTFMDSVRERVEQIKKAKRKAIIKAREYDAPFTAQQRTLSKNKPPIGGRKTRITRRAQYRKPVHYKSGLNLGRAE